jgi:hypothetical protein
MQMFGEIDVVEGQVTKKDIENLDKTIRGAIQAKIESDPELREQLHRLGIYSRSGVWVETAFTAEGGVTIGSYCEGRGFDLIYNFGYPYKLDSFGYPMNCEIFRETWDDERKQTAEVAQKLTDVANLVIERTAAALGYFPLVVNPWGGKELLRKSDIAKIRRLRMAEYLYCPWCGETFDSAHFKTCPSCDLPVERILNQN